MKLRMMDITFHANKEYTNTADLLRAQESSVLYRHAMYPLLSLEIIKHIGNPRTKMIPVEGFHFFRGRNLFFYLPLASLFYLKKNKPDIILVQGLAFPFQVMALRFLMGNRPKIIVKHHADNPSRGLRKIFQRWANLCTDAYLFTSKGNAAAWISAGIINNDTIIEEIPATYTAFKKKDKTASRLTTGMGKGLQYLWVGRLNDNKDPLTILRAFNKFLSNGIDAQLHFIYQTEELLSDMHTLISQNPLLQQNVLLHGYVKYEDLPDWYSAADFYISGSYHEAGSAGLLEAMACGCIPLVTDIPSAKKVTADGEFGFHFTPGNENELAECLQATASLPASQLPDLITRHFQKKYSQEAVAENLFVLCRRLTTQ